MDTIVKLNNDTAPVARGKLVDRLLERWEEVSALIDEARAAARGDFLSCNIIAVHS